MNRSFEVLSQEERDEDLASLAAQLGRFMFFAGDVERAMQRVETALEVAEALWIPEALSNALNTKSVILTSSGRRNEGLALLRYALEVGLEHDKPSAALRAYFNLGDVLCHLDRYEEAEHAVREGLEFARRVGNRYWEWNLIGQGYPLFALGKWDDLLARLAELPEDKWDEARQAAGVLVSIGVAANSHLGNLGEAARIIETLAEWQSSADVQERGSYHCGHALLLLAHGRASDALAEAREALGARETMGFTQEYVKEAFVTATEAALQLGDVAAAEAELETIESLPRGQRSQFLQAQVLRFRARVAATRGQAERVEDLFKGAAGLFRELSIPFYMACTELEHAEWLSAGGRAAEAEPLLAEAREVFERLGARPWLERAARAPRTREAEVIG
jgi:tetratricopeptide (TPR) repeat protein